MELEGATTATGREVGEVVPTATRVCLHALREPLLACNGAANELVSRESEPRGAEGSSTTGKRKQQVSSSPSTIAFLATAEVTR